MSINLTQADNNVPLFSLEGIFCECKVVDVYDGDTCKVVFPLHDKLYRWNVRLDGYDTPEMRPRKNKPNREQEIAAAKEAKKFLKDLVMKSPEQLVYIKCKEFDKYGRLLADLFVCQDDKCSVNQMMIDNGHGYVYNGGKKKEF